MYRLYNDLGLKLCSYSGFKYKNSRIDEMIIVLILTSREYTIIYDTRYTMIDTIHEMYILK